VRSIAVVVVLEISFVSKSAALQNQDLVEVSRRIVPINRSINGCDNGT
jgi:hypothetical protein